jgi:hypothetical protein
VGGQGALWFVGASAAALVLAWLIPLLYDTHQADSWRRDKEYKLIDKMIDKAGPAITVEELRQIASVLETEPRGARGLTQSLLGLIIATFVGFAMIATLISTSGDSEDLRQTIITALLSILATIAGFYFGARTAQISTEQATRPPEARPQSGPIGGGGGGPTISRLEPSTGRPDGGTEVTVTGTGLGEAPSVKFGNSEGVVQSSSETEIKVLTPKGVAGETVPVTVVTRSGQSDPKSAHTFTYESEPQTSGATPQPHGTVPTQKGP